VAQPVREAVRGVVGARLDPAAGVTSVLSCEGLTVRFGGVVALDGVDLDVAAGEVVGLLGPNGAGKTTLFDCLSGVRRPTAGTVALGDDDVTARSATWRSRQGLRRTFQRQQTFGRLTVEENVLVAAEWMGGGGGLFGDVVRLPARTALEHRRRQEVGDLLARCGLEDVRHIATCRLPIGTARLVELARALVGSPRVLLLDEPTSGLHHREVERVGGIVSWARSELGCGVVLVEHDVNFVTSHSDVVVVLDRGTVIAKGSPEAIQRDDLVRSVYLGTPAA
jgi:branched-chain amino acid transport system ATP-binding protein